MRFLKVKDLVLERMIRIYGWNVPLFHFEAELVFEDAPQPRNLTANTKVVFIPPQ